MTQPMSTEQLAEVEQLRAELEEAAAARRRVERERDLMGKRVEQGRRAAVAYVERITEVEAERDRLAEEIRKAAAYLIRRADLGANLCPSECTALADDLYAALDGTEAGR